jgi:molybdopterin synthase catalytic subunit
VTVAGSERILARIATESLDSRELENFVATRASGGIAIFAGVVRDAHAGRGVERIEYVAAADLALAQLRRIAAAVLEDPAIHRVAAAHRLGLLEVGEASVIVAASAAHREEAFRAARTLIDRIKEVLPVWKREHFADGTVEWAAGFTIAEADRAPGVSPAGTR